LVEVEAAKGVPYRRPNSELPSCDMRCTAAVEEKDYDVMFFIDGVPSTFNIRYAPSL
jgi:hypothetical protein